MSPKLTESKTFAFVWTHKCFFKVKIASYDFQEFWGKAIMGIGSSAGVVTW